jgi:hypothetical protein
LLLLALLLVTVACKAQPAMTNIEELEAFAEQLEGGAERDIMERLDELEAYAEQSAERRVHLRELLKDRKIKSPFEEKGGKRDRFVSVLHRITVAASAIHREASAAGPLAEARARDVLSLFSLARAVP